MAGVTVLAGTAEGLRGVAGSDDALAGLDVTALTSDQWGTWAITGGRALWRRTQGPWVEVTQATGPAARCLLGTDDGLFIGTAEAGLLRLEDGVLERVQGFDEVEGRDTWYTPWGGPPDTRSLARDTGGAIHANVHVGGIVRSRDKGATWEPTIDIDADVHQVHAHPDRPSHVLAACAHGLAESTDGGDTWEIRDNGLHASYARAVVVAGDTVLVTSSTGPFTDRAAVYMRAIDTAKGFERCTAGLPEWFPSNIDTHCLAASGSRVALGTDEGEVFLSEDAGKSWERAANDLPPVRCLAWA